MKTLPNPKALDWLDVTSDKARQDLEPGYYLEIVDFDAWEAGAPHRWALWLCEGTGGRAPSTVEPYEIAYERDGGTISQSETYVI